MEIREKGTCLLCEYLIVINNLQRTYTKPASLLLTYFITLTFQKKKKKEKSKITTNLSLVLVQI